MIDNLNISPLINRMCKYKNGIGLSAHNLSQRAINKIFNGSIEDQWSLFPYLSKFGISFPHSLLNEWKRCIWKTYSNKIKTIIYAEIIKSTPRVSLRARKAYVDRAIQDLMSDDSEGPVPSHNIMRNINDKHPQTFDEFWNMLDAEINQINLGCYRSADDLINFWTCYIYNHANSQYTWDNYNILNSYKIINLFNKKPKALEKLYNKSLASLQPANRN